MKRRSPKNLMPVVIGLLIVIVGSMMWNMQESFAMRRVREGATGSSSGNKEKSCTKDSDCTSPEKCKDKVCK